MVPTNLGGVVYDMNADELKDKAVEIMKEGSVFSKNPAISQVADIMVNIWFKNNTDPQALDAIASIPGMIEEMQSALMRLFKAAFALGIASGTIEDAAKAEIEKLEKMWGDDGS